MGFNKILVPVCGTEADEEGIKLACVLAKKAKGKICAVYVITVKRSLPLEAESAVPRSKTAKWRLMCSKPARSAQRLSMRQWNEGQTSS